jgi:hypothetical protein
MKQTTSQSGVAHLSIIVAIVATFAVTAVGVNVYRVQQSNRGIATESVDDNALTAAELKAEGDFDLAKVREVSDDTPTEQPVDDSKLVESQPVPAPPKPPTTTTTQKTTEPVATKPKPTVQQVNIRSTFVQVNASSITFSAELPASYSGTCKTLLKRPDGTDADARWFEQAFSGAACSVSVDRAKLPAGDWQFYMYFYSKDAATKGSSGSKTFSL